MLKAIKNNRSVRIAERKAGAYKKLGYTIKDMNGNTVYEPGEASKKATKKTATAAE